MQAPHKMQETQALRGPTATLGGQSAAMLRKDGAGWNRPKSALEVSVPADIRGGDAVADETPSRVSDALSVRNYR